MTISKRIILFSCQHNLCHKCSFTFLLNFISKSSQGLSGNFNFEIKFPCPICSKGDSPYLINDFLSDEVVKKSFTQNLYGKTCDSCDSYELQSYCYQCKSYFCKKCFEKIHNFIIPFRQHRVTENFSNFPDKIFCNCCMEEKEVFFLCCERFLCEMCIIRYHLTHKFKFIIESPDEDLINYANSTNFNFNNETLTLDTEYANRNELTSKINTESLFQLIDQIHNNINNNYAQNKIIFNNQINDCLRTLSVLHNKLKSTVTNMDIVYSDFLFFLDA